MEPICAAPTPPAPANEAKPAARQTPRDATTPAFAELLRAAGAGGQASPPVHAATDAPAAQGGSDSERAGAAARQGRDGAARPQAAREGERGAPDAKPATTPGDAEESDKGTDAAEAAKPAASADPAAAALAAAAQGVANPALASSVAAAADGHAADDGENARGPAPPHGRAPRLPATGRALQPIEDEARRPGPGTATTDRSRQPDGYGFDLSPRSGMAEGAQPPPGMAEAIPSVDRAAASGAATAVSLPTGMAEAIPSVDRAAASGAATAVSLPTGMAAQSAQPLASTTATPQTGAPATAPWHERQIAEFVGTPGFAPALGTTLAVLTREGVQQARLRLNPAEMGPIAVQIAVEGNSARIDFQAAVAATRSALEAALPMLAGALHEAGLTLTGGGVHDQFAGQSNPSAADSARTADDHSKRADPPRETAPTVAGQRVRRGLVDLVA